MQSKALTKRNHHKGRKEFINEQMYAFKEMFVSRIGTGRITYPGIPGTGLPQFTVRYKLQSGSNDPNQGSMAN